VPGKGKEFQAVDISGFIIAEIPIGLFIWFFGLRKSRGRPQDNHQSY
jgi:hypothetical protein